MKELTETVFRAMNGRDFELFEEIISEGDRSCAVWTNEGGAMDGTPYANSGITQLHFRDRKISFISDNFKDTSFTG